MPHAHPPDLIQPEPRPPVDHRSITEADWWSVSFREKIPVVDFFGEIGFGRPVKELIDRTSNFEEFNFRIDTIGGSAADAREVLRHLEGRVREAIIPRRAYSAGYVIALAADRVLMGPDAKIMLHAPSSFVYGTAEELARESERLCEAHNELFKRLKIRTECSTISALSWLEKDDWYFTAEQAVACGLADGILLPPKPSPLPSSAAAAPVVATARKMPEQKELTEDERFLLDALKACGPVQTSDINRLLREINSWVVNNHRIE